MTDWLNYQKTQKFQLGGQVENDIATIAQAYMSGDPQAKNLLVALKDKAAEDPKAAQLLQSILGYIQRNQSQSGMPSVVSAEEGAKMSYLKSLNEDSFGKVVPTVSTKCADCVSLERRGGILLNIDARGRIIR